MCRSEDFDKLFPDNRQSGSSTLRQAQLVMLRMLRVVDYICRQHDIPYWLCSGTLLGAVRHQGFIPWDDDLDIAMLREDYERFLKIALESLPADMFLQTKETEPAFDIFSLPCKIRDTKSLIISHNSKNRPYHQGIFIDIFPFDRFHLNGFRRKKEVWLKIYYNLLCRSFNAELEKDKSFFKMIVSWFKPVFHYLLIKYRRKVAPVIQGNKKLPDNQCFVGHGFDTQWLRSFRMHDIFPLQKITFENNMFFAPGNVDAYLKHIYGDTYMTPPPEKERTPSHGTIIKPILE